MPWRGHARLLAELVLREPGRERVRIGVVDETVRRGDVVRVDGRADWVVAGTPDTTNPALDVRVVCTRRSG